MILYPLLVWVFSFHGCAAQDVGEYPRAKEPGHKVKREYVPDELLVLFKEGTSESRVNEINESMNVHLIRTMLPGRSYLIKVPKAKSLEQVRQDYFSFPEVEDVGLNYKARILNQEP